MDSSEGRQGRGQTGQAGEIDRSSEAVLDSLFANVSPRSSGPGRFKSWFAREEEGWTATLKVDFDDERNVPTEQGTRYAGRFLARRGFRLVEIKAYRTRKGLHLRVWLSHPNGRQLTERQILGLQQELGDDPVRCRFNRERVEDGETGWNVLWSEKWHNGRRVMCETSDPEWTARFVAWLGG